MSRIRSVARAGAAVGAASVASRLLGFARDVLIAGVLGAGVVADAFLVAFRIPNVIRRVLGEGALNAGFVPLYGEVRARAGAQAARKFAGRAIVNTALFFAALAGLAEVLAGTLVLAVAAGFSDDAERFTLAVHYTRLALPFVAFTGLASLLAALLNAEHRFLAAAIAPALVNGVLIAALLLLAGGVENDPATGAWLAGAISLSGALHLSVVVWAAARLPERPRLTAPALDSDTRRLVRFALPAFVASSMTQIILLAAMVLASGQPSMVSWLYYADRVFQLPLSFIGVAAGVVLLPEFVERRGRTAGGSAPALTRYLTGALALALPAAAGLIALAPAIVAVLFERGAFTAADSWATAGLLVALATGLPAAGASKVLMQPFFARRQVGPPLIAGFAGVLATLGGGELLAVAWGSAVEWHPPFADEPVVLGTVGLAASLGLWAQALVLGGAARAQIARPVATLARIGRLALAAMLMAAAVAATANACAHWLAEDRPFLLRGAVLAALCASGILVYALAARTLRALDPLTRGRTGSDDPPADFPCGTASPCDNPHIEPMPASRPTNDRIE